jgi:plastocyanin
MNWVLLSTALGLMTVPPANATIHSITVGNNFFSPLKTTVHPGDTVRWVWAGGVPHTTSSDPSSPKFWNSPTSSTAGFVFNLQFTSADGPGPFPYHCAVHPTTMKDTIFVAPPPCCNLRVGDVNGAGTYPNEVTIGDIQLMVTALFISSLPCGQNLHCLAEADVNQSGGANPKCTDITIADIQTLVNHLFICGPVSCPLKTCL